ncbi:ABC transporter permease [Micromonospora sp. NPDC048830]|uniref:ABC transporter permease n=1 Tax=Micromonospora sp. NPDC048830 TaxID=3364257 RepID=UPI0037214B09
MIERQAAAQNQVGEDQIMSTKTAIDQGPRADTRGRSWVSPTFTMIAIIGAWELYVRVTDTAEYLLPAPSAIAEYMVEDYRVLATNTLSTAYVTLAGFAIAMVLGLGLAVILVASERVERALFPLIITSQVIPKVAVAPVLVVWMGFGDAPKITLTVLISFLPIVLNAVLGMKSLDGDIMNLYRSLKSKRHQEFLYLRFPNAIPYIIEGAKVAITLALIGSVVGEFMSGTSGLGYLIASSSARMETVRAFATFPILALVGIVFFYVIEAVGRVIAPWERRY